MYANFAILWQLLLQVCLYRDKIILYLLCQGVYFASAIKRKTTKMELERLSERNKQHLAAATALYEQSFPYLEKRSEGEQSRVMNNPDYRFDLITDDDRLLGILAYWEKADFLYVEHFAILPEFRGRGFATRTLEILKNQTNKNLILEIDPPVDDVSEKRYRFYQKCGFVMNPHCHTQAKYHLGDGELQLKILSYPREITKEEYATFKRFVDDEVSVKPIDELTVRPMQDCDDKTQVAKLIYLSDRYIYPYWFDSIEDGEKVIAKMTSLPTLYNQKNVTVAVTKDGFVAGAMVSKRTPVVENEEEIRKAFEEAGVKCDERTHKIFCDYYAKMFDEKDYYYVANVAVDPLFRGKGIASKLITQTVSDKGECHLECVIANPGAWKLYQRLGFEIVEEYPGVFDVPCYAMVKK